MAQRMRVTTYKDVIDHLADYLGAASDEVTIRLARRAIQNACNDLPAVRNWSYFFTRGRIQTVAPQTTGTVVYTHSTRTVTLTGSTFPTWAVDGVIAINNVPYSVAANPTTTTLTLQANVNPGADVASTTYTLYKDTYSMPIDFVSMDAVQNLNNGAFLSYSHLNSWLELQRNYAGPALPYVYSITGSPDYMGVMSLRILPPDAIYNLDFIYKRRPRQLNQVLYSTGTCATTSGSTTVTGTGTSWLSTMAGSVIRFSNVGDAAVPTGPGGQSPAMIERMIAGYTSTTSLTLDVDPGQTLANNIYAISDPLDIEEGAMMTFFYREAEKQMRILTRTKPTDTEERQYGEAMHRAFEADARSTERQVYGGGQYMRRFKDMPGGLDQG